MLTLRTLDEKAAMINRPAQGALRLGIAGRGDPRGRGGVGRDALPAGRDGEY